MTDMTTTVTDDMVAAARAAYAKATGCEDNPHVLDGWIEEALCAALNAGWAQQREKQKGDLSSSFPPRHTVGAVFNERAFEAAKRVYGDTGTDHFWSLRMAICAYLFDAANAKESEG